MGGLFGGGSTISHEESRINALRIQQSTYGAVIPIVFGTTRITGNFLDYDDFTAIPHTTTQSSGGKGGGGVTQTETTYTYTTAIIIGLCEAIVQKIGQVWSGKEITTLAAKSLEMYQNQIWPYMQSKHPDKALAYKDTTYVAGVIDLGSSGDVPNLSFEVFALCQYGRGIIDALPTDVIRELLVNDQFGIDFPVSCIGDLTLYTSYCIANGLFISPAFTEQKECRENITDILQCTNSEAVWSQGKFKIVPYGDEVVSGNGVTYNPPPAPWYDLDNNDFLPDDDEMPVICKRSRTADAYNIQPFEFLSRANGYNIETDDVKDAANIGMFGPRPAEPISMHFFCDKQAAKTAAQGILQRKLYKRNQYEFKLGWKYYRLEPMDIVTLTEENLGLVKEPVQIVSIEEINNGRFQIVAEECPAGVHGITKYPCKDAERSHVNYNCSPGEVATPIIFEPPAETVQNGLELCVATCGGTSDFWGGACVWVSYDGDTYKQIGRITAPARIGKLITALPEGYSKDYQNKLSVKLQGRADLLSGTAADADMKNTLCYVDGEFISYETAILKGVAQYDLYGLRRGAYGSTIKSHAAGSDFVRVDNAIFHYPYRVEDIGRTIFIKFTSYNIFGVSMQELSEVDAYRYTIQGAEQSVPAVSFAVTQDGEKLTASLDRTFLDSNNNSFFSYELRFGTSWDSGVLMGIFSGSRYTFDAPQEGTLTFWLRAVDNKGNASKTAARATVNVVGLPKRNVLFERTDAPDGWTVENMYRVASGYTLQGIKVLGDYEKFFDIFVIPPYLTDSAYIYLPLIDLGENIIESDCYYIDPQGEWHLRSVETLRDYGKFFDIFGAPIHYVTPKYAVQTFATIDVQYDHKQNIRLETEYRVSFDGKVWSDWVTSTQKQFYGRFVAIRIHPVSLDRLTNTVVRSVKVSIDVPDLEDRIVNVDVPTQKTHVAFHRHFTLPPMLGIFAQDLNGKQATWRVSNITETGFDIELLDASGNLIAGKLPLIIARGY